MDFPSTSLVHLLVLSSVIFVQLRFDSPVNDFMGIVFDATKRHTLTVNSTILWLLQSFYPLFHNIP